MTVERDPFIEAIELNATASISRWRCHTLWLEMNPVPAEYWENEWRHKQGSKHFEWHCRLEWQEDCVRRLLGSVADRHGHEVALQCKKALKGGFIEARDYVEWLYRLSMSDDVDGRAELPEL